VRAVAAGQILGVRRSGARGLEVVVKHGEAWTARYAHVGSVAPALASGKRVVASGEAIGRVGRTGITYATHLHLEMTVNGVVVDPAPYFLLRRCGQSSGPS
jgi:murein DD-endopeptidase MepM/ murein hydrolase activator NlpD